MNELPPPHSLEAETSLLGAILVRGNEALSELPELKPDHFYRDAHQRIFRAVQRLDVEGKPIDYGLLCESLKQTGELEEVNGPAFISSLTDGVPRATNSRHYANVVLEHALRRVLIAEANRVIAAAYEGEKGARELLDETESRLLGLDVRVHGAGNDGVDAEKLANDATPVMHQLWKERGARGIRSGIGGLDVAIRGAKKGELIVVGARPSMGKTALALQWALNAADNVWTVFFTLEMSKLELTWRALSHMSHYSVTTITGEEGGTDAFREAISQEMCLFARKKIIIDETPAITVSQVRAKCRRYKQQRKGLGVVFIDYLQLMGNDKGLKADNRNLELSHITRTLKALAKELEVPVVLLSQLNRGVETRTNKRPMLSDLRESGAIEQDADVVIMPHRPHYYEPDKAPDYAELIVAKQRNGATGLVETTWHAHYTTFVDRHVPSAA